MVGTDLNTHLGQAVFNYLRHAAAGAPAEVLGQLREGLEGCLAEVLRQNIAIDPGIYEMLKLALEQNLGAIPTQVESRVEPAPVAAPPDSQRQTTVKYELPRYYPPSLPPLELSVPAESPEGKPAAPQAAAQTLFPTYVRPVNNGNSNARWVGSRNVYTRYFSALTHR